MLEASCAGDAFYPQNLGFNMHNWWLALIRTLLPHRLCEVYNLFLVSDVTKPWLLFCYSGFGCFLFLWPHIILASFYCLCALPRVLRMLTSLLLIKLFVHLPYIHPFPVSVLKCWWWGQRRMARVVCADRTATQIELGWAEKHLIMHNILNIEMHRLQQWLRPQWIWEAEGWKKTRWFFFFQFLTVQIQCSYFCFVLGLVIQLILRNKT